MKNPIMLYYKVNNNTEYCLEKTSYSQLYHDEECKNLAGYYCVSKNRNPIDTCNLIASTNMILYFGERIVEYSYVKKNNDEINTPIIFDNTWDGKSNIGYVNRLVLKNNVTRKITIY